MSIFSSFVDELQKIGYVGTPLGRTTRPELRRAEADVEMARSLGDPKARSQAAYRLKGIRTKRTYHAKDLSETRKAMKAGDIPPVKGAKDIAEKRERARMIALHERLVERGERKKINVSGPSRKQIIKSVEKAGKRGGAAQLEKELRR